ncbi:ABC transporter substrate-binding protein [Paenibacillus sp. sptzw28]|uniref:ABC transporter substrate-binding protein n=1 Tax=Paenibacillus sp. sptzw28 TaxID=715179 RepID=UPI001C6E51F2|nr:ABC transporter substrate-binding protein [Paenibacillus sp. sptzw28]QYR19380.1 ABC transporter substrate-binding protein [Paenibacillus sp. sptzw28]
MVIVHRNKKSGKRVGRLLPVTFVLCLVIAMAVTGCSKSGTAGTGGNAGSGTGTGSGSDADAKVTTIDFWFPWAGDYQRDFKKYVVDEFEKKHPEIKVKMTFVETSGSTQASDKLLTAIAGGNPPDVALFDRFLIGSWADKGSLEDLTPYIEASGISPNDYYAPIWKEAVYKDKVYALPWATDTRALYYNKDLMKAAGLDPDSPPKTIQELDQMAEKMFKKGKNGKYESVGFIPWMNQGFLYTQAWNWGGKWEDANGNLTPNDPQNVKALDWMAGYAKKYDVATLTSFSDAVGQTGMNPFWTGEVGFVMDGNWILNDLKKYDIKFNWGVTYMPPAEGYQPTTWAGGWSYIIPKGSKKVDAAWEFVKFVAGKEGTMLWAKRPTAGNDITAMPSVNDELKLQDIPNLKIFIDGVKTGHTRPVTPVGSFLWNETMRVQDLAIHGKGTGQQLLDEVKKNVDNELAKLNSK